MARARNIKPSFFANDDLAECSPLARLLFISLWTLADRDGRLEDKPKKIKVQSLPYDDCDCDLLLEELNRHGFIIRYIANKNSFIQVVNFAKHQNPHCKEGASTIPAPCNNSVSNIDSGLDDLPAKNIDSEHVENKEEIKVQYEHGASTVQEQDRHITSRADSLNLIPDSLNLIPDSLNLIPESLAQQVAPPPEEPASQKKGTRLPEDWKLSEESYQYAIGRGLDHQAILDEAIKFKNYWLSKTGKDATKLNWSLTWQNWVITATKNTFGKSVGQSKPSSKDVPTEYTQTETVSKL